MHALSKLSMQVLGVIQSLDFVSVGFDLARTLVSGASLIIVAMKSLAYFSGNSLALVLF